MIKKHCDFCQDEINDERHHVGEWICKNDGKRYYFQVSISGQKREGKLNFSKVDCCWKCMQEFMMQLIETSNRGNK
jgi:hypothetical protein